MNRSTLAYIANTIPRRGPFTGEDTLITGKRTDGQLFHVRVTTSPRVGWEWWDSIRGDCGTHSRYPCQKRGPKVQDELTANETTHKNSRLEEREPRPTDDVTEHTGGLARVGLARKLARRRTGIGHVTKHVSNGRTRDSDSSQMTKDL